MAEHFPEVSTDARLASAPVHQAACACGWKGRRRLNWIAACEEADRHIEKAQQAEGNSRG